MTSRFLILLRSAFTCKTTLIGRSNNTLVSRREKWIESSREARSELTINYTLGKKMILWRCLIAVCVETDPLTT